MKKSVVFNGNNIKVDFNKDNYTRTVTQMDGIRIAKAHGSSDFIINGKSYPVQWIMNTAPSITLHFEGYTCGDSEKKMIEHIISKYGI